MSTSFVPQGWRVVSVDKDRPNNKTLWCPELGVMQITSNISLRRYPDWRIFVQLAADKQPCSVTFKPDQMMDYEYFRLFFEHAPRDEQIFGALCKAKSGNVLRRVLCDMVCHLLQIRAQHSGAMLTYASWYINKCAEQDATNYVQWIQYYTCANIVENRANVIDNTTFEVVPFGDRGSVRPLVLVGPSGAGKDTLLDRLLRDYAATFAKRVSHTSRIARPGEVDGMHYHFSTREQMVHDRDAGLFLETAEVHGNLYGTSLESILTIMRGGRVPALILDVQGAQSVHALGLNPVCIFVDAPSLDELASRLRKRCTDDAASISCRLQTAQDEIKFADEHPELWALRVTNTDLEQTYAVLVEKLTSINAMPL